MRLQGFAPAPSLATLSSQYWPGVPLSVLIARVNEGSGGNNLWGKAGIAVNVL